MTHREHTEDAPTSAPHPWHIRPGESSLAYRSLYEYLWMGRKRSLAKLARKQERGRSDRPDAGLSQLKTWSVRWDWHERAAAYDAEQLRLDIAYRDRDRVVDVVLDRAVNVVLAAIVKADPDKMTAADALALVDKIVRLDLKRRPLDQPAKKTQ